MSLEFKAEWADDDFVGGHVAADFVNTAGGATKARNVERLVDYLSVVQWARATALLTENESRQLSIIADTDPDAAQAALEALQSFREALHACLMSQQSGAAWPLQPRLAVEMSIKKAIGDADLDGDGEHFRWVATLERCRIDLVLRRISLAAEALLRSDDLPRLKNCERCSWLFVDRGRGRPRRWCSMAACGSRAKSARYYLRHRSLSDQQRD